MDINAQDFPNADHPRACGENYRFSGIVRCSLGSPPRVRGKRTWRRYCESNGRITPARAGKTISHASEMENECGSPPRVRGKRDLRQRDGAARRITPARAGKTNRNGPKITQKKDHPRACGENPICPDIVAAIPGSPPRVRGKPVIAESKRQNEGITPARAGKTAHVLGGPALAQDHPRACGENGRGSGN